MAYTRVHADWKNKPDSSTPVDDVALEHIEQGIVDAHDAIAALPAAPTADTLGGATTVGKAVIKAVDGAAARTAIGAGTSSLALGTTATTALKGDTVIPAATAAGTRAQLDAGTDTTVRAFSAKDIADFVAAKIAAIPPA